MTVSPDRPSLPPRRDLTDDRVIRHVDTWTVFKVLALVNLVTYAAALISETVSQKDCICFQKLCKGLTKPGKVSFKTL